MVCAALLWFIDIAMLFCGLQRWSSYRELTGAVSAYRFSNFHLTRDSRLLTCIMLQVHTHHRRPRYPPWTLGRTCKLAASGGGSPPPARHRPHHAASQLAASRPYCHRARPHLQCTSAPTTDHDGPATHHGHWAGSDFGLRSCGHVFVAVVVVVVVLTNRTETS